MVSIQECVDQVMRHLGGSRDAVNRLQGSIGPEEYEVQFSYPINGIVAGSLIELEGINNDEKLRVWEAFPDERRAIVERRVRPSTPLPPDASPGLGTDPTFGAGRTVRVQPRFFRVDAWGAINDELRALSSQGLFEPASVEADWDEDEHGYLFGEDHLSVYAVEQHAVRRDKWFYDFQLEGGVLRVPHGVPRRPATVHFRAPLRTWDVDKHHRWPSRVDLVDDLGVPETAQDIPAVGAAMRMLLAKEATRVDVEAHDHARRAEDVPPGSVASLVNQLRATRDMRLGDEVRRLRQSWPLRSV